MSECPSPFDECTKINKSFFQKLNDWFCNFACKFTSESIGENDTFGGFITRVDNSETGCRTALISPPAPKTYRISNENVTYTGTDITPFINAIGSNTVAIYELTHTVNNTSDFPMIVSCFCRAGHWATNYERINPNQDWLIDYKLVGDSPLIRLSSFVFASGNTPVVSNDTVTIQAGDSFTFDAKMYLQSNNYIEDESNTIQSNFVYFDIVEIPYIG